MEKSLKFIVIIFLCALSESVVSRRPPACYVNNNTDTSNGDKIVGGTNTTIQKYPYQAYLMILRADEDYQCGGSIIDSYNILTAAHCLAGASMVTARIGSTYSNYGGTTYTSVLIFRHPRYQYGSFDYDIGFVRFSQLNIDGVNTRIIPLASAGTPVPPGTKLTVTGWGATTEDGYVVENLMVVQVPVVPNMQCSRSYESITPRMLCAGVPKGGKDSCGGDSGGPAVANDGKQLGLVSNGIGCGRPGIPGVYTSIPALRSWIRLSTGT